MPGWPSSTCVMLSPTGCTKQLMSVAASPVPAADWMRPAGMKPCCSACRKRSSHSARCSGASASASARATRRFTSSGVVSSPLAYFSFSTSALMAWGGSARTAASGARFGEVGSVTMGILDAFGGCGFGRETLAAAASASVLRTIRSCAGSRPGAAALDIGVADSLAVQPGRGRCRPGRFSAAPGAAACSRPAPPSSASRTGTRRRHRGRG